MQGKRVLTEWGWSSQRATESLLGVGAASQKGAPEPKGTVGWFFLQLGLLEPACLPPNVLDRWSHINSGHQ